MTGRTAIRAVGSLLVCVAAAAGFAAPGGPAAASTPTETGCPAAYELLSVSWLESQGPYRLPRQLDEAGNADGYVCGRETEDHAAANYCDGPCPAQLYDFSENDRTPGHHA
ncbi:MAG: hypothetical protein ABR549_16910 [Mycobacteriales bacterium]